jgi:hypothetical protein
VTAIILVVTFVLGAIVLALGQSLYRMGARWYERHKRKIDRQMQVTVIVDRNSKRRRRTCFWPEVLDSEKYDIRYRVNHIEYSIADTLDKKRNPAVQLFSPERSNIIVINWDAINGDPVYGSDRAYQFLERYRSDLREWLRQGGVLIVESQGVSWGASDDAYNMLCSMFSESRITLFSEMWAVGDAAAVHPRRLSNPLLIDLKDDDAQIAQGGLWARKQWFPKDFISSDAQSARFVRRHQQLLYRGWFTSWTADWNPILTPKPPAATATADGRQAHDTRAVALYRRVKPHHDPSEPAAEAGYVVLTTMFLASSELYTFISNCISLAEKARLESEPLPHQDPTG